MTAEPWVAVVIPAHNEAAVVGRCLDRLLEGAPPGIQAVVVSNGSVDDTVLRAQESVPRYRNAGHDLRVETLPVAGKPGAVRHGVSTSSARPLVVLDADVELTGASLKLLARTLQDDSRPLAAVLRADLVASRSTWLVRRWVAVFRELPYARNHMIGSGVVAVNALGAQLLEGLPDVLNDDAWIRQQFSAGQRAPADVTFTVHAPRTLPALVSRRARVTIGNAEMRRLVGTDEAGTGLGDLVTLVRTRRVAPSDVAAFVAVTLLVRVLVAVRRLRGNSRTWGHDRTSRSASA